MWRSIPVVALILLAGCQAAEEPRRQLIVSGSETLAPLVDELAARFQDDYPGVRINVNFATTKQGIDGIRQGLIDVALLARPLRPDETDLEGFPFACDGLGFLVNAANPIGSLEEKQLVGLITRAYIDWQEVGGTALPLIVVGPTEGRSLLEAFLPRFNLPATAVRLDLPLYRDEQVVDAVARTPGALGFVSLAAVSKLKELPGVRLLSQNNVAATLVNLKNGRYPYTRPLVAATRKREAGLAQDFLKFMKTAAVADLIEKHGFAPQPPGKNTP